MNNKRLFHLSIFLFRDLWDSYKMNADELLDLFDTLVSEHAWDPDIEEFFRQRRNSIRRISHVINFIPTSMILPYITLLDRKESLSPDEIDFVLGGLKLTNALILGGVDPSNGVSQNEV